MASTPQYLSAAGGAEVLAQAQGLVLVGRPEPHAVDTGRTTAQPLEPYLERDLGVVDDHLGRVLRRDADALLGDEDVEAVGLEDVRVAARPLDRLPELGGIVVGHPGPGDRRRVWVGAETDE